MRRAERGSRAYQLTACVLVLALPHTLHAAEAAKPATAASVIQFSPQGVVKDVRQVTARFSAPMVPLGDPRRAADPFTRECPEKGSARWIDSRTWVFDFERDLPAGLRCAFTLRADLRSLGGAPVSGPQAFAFSTGGPTIRSSTPYSGEERIEEEQAFILSLDAAPTPESVLRHVAFAVDGLPERIGARIVSDETRATILAALPPWQVPDEPLLIVQAVQRFPNGKKVQLIWGKGIAATSGVATDQDQVLDFVTRPEFTAQLYCERMKASAPCIPILPLSVSFSAPVAWERAQQITLTAPGQPPASPKAPDTPAEFVSRVTFAGPFPESSAVEIALPADLRDDAGRALLNQRDFPLSVKTDGFPPLAKFAARFGILEAKADPALPVTLRNVEPALAARLHRATRERAAAGGVGAALGGIVDSVTGNVQRIAPQDPEDILPWLRRVALAKRDRSLFAAVPDAAAQPFTLPKTEGVETLEVVGIPFKSPGLYIVELESPRLGAALLDKPKPMYVPAAALVTNLSVHFKAGRENAIAWVTTLDAAEPVAGAHVTVQDCSGSVLARGDTDEHGIAHLDGLPPFNSVRGCYDADAFEDWEAPDYADYYQNRALTALDSGLFVVAQTADDLSFVHSAWSKGIETWRFDLPSEDWDGPVVAHTIFDRTLFRAGETVHMKHILRSQALRGFALVPDAERPALAVVQHLGSNETYELPLAWDPNGSAESTWPIPPAAKLGRYDVTLKQVAPPAGVATPAPGRPLRQWRGGSFRVEEFRVPLLKATLRLPPEPQVAVGAVPVDIAVQYLAGGAAANLPVALRAYVRPKAFTPPEELESFTFANGPVAEGLVRGGEEVENDGPPAAASLPVHQRHDLMLDASGTAQARIDSLPPAETVRELLAEAELRDPNGEVQTISSSVPLWPASWLAGIKAEFWAGTAGSLRARVAVVDTAGKAVSGAAARVDILQRRTYSHRKRLVGGFYGYEYVRETWPVGTLCEGVTDAHGLLWCEGAPPQSGQLILQASVADAAGRRSVAHTDIWVEGDSDWRFEVDPSDRIDVLPEQRRYEPGDTARFQVRMPFQEATALVTVEREGIIEAHVEHISGRQPVIEVPVLGEYAPNVFVSVFAVRGRVGDGPAPTAMVDLGRPAFKLGIAEIRVGWRAHELRVQLSSDRQVYRVRDKATVDIAVRTADGAAPPAGSEVALAAVDEGLLELEPNRSWNLLDALMGRRGYGVRNATAQMQVIGKRHFGRKAVTPGGGGGRQSTRELFDTLLIWRGRVPLDANGDARVEVPLNDSLTGFRIVAVATGGVELFGSGAMSIRSTQDLMLFSGLAPLVREGDRLPAEFTVRNTTERPLDVTVRGRAEGLPAELSPQAVALAAGEARVVSWDVTVPADVERLSYEIEASVAGAATDRLRVAQRVRPAVPVRTLQATLLRYERPLSLPVERPADALPGRGGVAVALAPTLAGSLDGVRAWMRDYPYTCLEQKVSRAVALGDAALRDEVLAAMPSYLDGDGLLKFFPTMPNGSEVLTSYVLSIANAAGWSLPNALNERLTTGLRRFVQGSLNRPQHVLAADLSLRKLAALAALARAGGVDANLAGSIAIEPNLWPTSALLDWWTVLDRVPGIAKRDQRRREAEQIVRARLNLQGSTMGFSTESGDELWWLMAGSDSNAARLTLHLLESKRWKEDLPRLMRGAIARQRRGAWENTVANAWGTLAVQRFATAFESTPVTGTTVAALADSEQQFDWRTPPPEPLLLPWPAQPAPLRVEHKGTGNPWVTVQSRAAVPLKAPLSSGYRITKTVTPLEPRADGTVRRGDRLRVRLEIDAQSDMTWVVVDDPVPAGASHLGSGLGRDSQVAAAPDPNDTALPPTFVERAFEGYRAYFEFLPKGPLVVEYAIRLNQSGTFQLPATRVEALYAPEMFGELPNRAITVAP